MLKQGKVIKFDKFVGYIKDKDNNEYLFLDYDLEEPINIGDLVTFKSEKFNDKYRAFSIKKIK